MKGSGIRNIIILLFVLFSLKGFGQQDPMFTQYMNNPGIINPAYAGSKGITNINGIFRKQWIGQEWSPMTTSISVNAPYAKYDVGLGLTLIDDQIGPSHQVGFYIDYAKYFNLKKGRNLSLGLKAGLNFFDINLMNMVMYEYDPYIAADPRNKSLLPNFGIGAFYYTDNFYAGISIPKLLRNTIRNSENVILGKEERHVFFTTGYVFVIDDPLWKMKASMMTRLVNGSPASLELSATAIMYDRVWFGLTYRFGDAIAAHARVQVNHNLQIGYSYDLNNSRLRLYNTGSHEIFISYDFVVKGQKILSPRYFL